MQNEEISKYMSALGKKGGTAAFKKHGPDFFSEIGKKGAKARWDKKRKEQQDGKKETGRGKPKSEWGDGEGPIDL